jgi:hypothetical protein
MNFPDSLDDGQALRAGSLARATPGTLGRILVAVRQHSVDPRAMSRTTSGLATSDERGETMGSGMMSQGGNIMAGRRSGYS